MIYVLALTKILQNEKIGFTRQNILRHKNIYTHVYILTQFPHNAGAAILATGVNLFRNKVNFCC